jgi:hypothetical protein
MLDVLRLMIRVAHAPLGASDDYFKGMIPHLRQILYGVFSAPSLYFTPAWLTNVAQQGCIWRAMLHASHKVAYASQLDGWSGDELEK